MGKRPLEVELDLELPSRHVGIDVDPAHVDEGGEGREARAGLDLQGHRMSRPRSLATVYRGLGPGRLSPHA